MLWFPVLFLACCNKSLFLDSSCYGEQAGIARKPVSEAMLLFWPYSLGLGNDMSWFTSKFKIQVCDLKKKKKRLSTHSKTSSCHKLWPWLFFLMAFLGQHTLYRLVKTFPATKTRILVCAYRVTYIISHYESQWSSNTVNDTWERSVSFYGYTGNAKGSAEIHLVHV